MSKYDDHYFMDKALEQARKSFREGGIPVGAVIAVPSWGLEAWLGNIGEQL